MYVQSYFNEKICLEHALKLLIKVGEVHLNEVIIQRTFEENIAQKNIMKTYIIFYKEIILKIGITKSL